MGENPVTPASLDMRLASDAPANPAARSAPAKAPDSALRPAPAKAPSFFQQYAILLRKDLLAEFRTREMLTSMGIYAVLVIIVYGAALGMVARGLDIAQLGGGLLWVLIVFTSLLGLGRSFAHEKEQGCMDGILLAPIDRSVIFLAKATANILFMLVVMVIVVPLFCFFFLTATPLAPTAPAIAAPIALGIVGMAGIGTMLSTITMHTRSRDVLLAVLFIAIIYPLLFACVTATTAALTGSTLWVEQFLIPLALAGGYDVIMILVCWVLYDFVISA